MNSFWRVAIVFLTFLAHIIVLITAREEFYLILGAFTGAFFFYLLIIEEYKLKDVFYMAVALRIIWLFSTPNLSNDYFRFLWDGELSASGINVFGTLPTDLAVDSEFSNLLNQELYDGMNSKDYFSVYPPVNQLYFLVSAIGGESLSARLFILKVVFFLTEFLGLLVLFKLATNTRVAKEKFALWALNPLVIIEGVGNLHFEVVMLVYVLLAVVYFKKNWMLSAVFCGLAISTKLLPIMFLPLLIPYFGWGRSIKYGALAGGVFLITFLPFLNVEIIQNIWSSIDLYFQTFEFNASIFYIVKYIGELTVGWDIIQTAGPIMAGVTILVIATLSFNPKTKNYITLPTALLAVSTVYLLMSTTVHPWYILIPFGISLFSKHKFPVWWTLLVFLSYSFYMNGTLEDKPLFLILQYGVLFLLIGQEILSMYKKTKSID
ncbi:MAG: hypothetical protein AB8B53_09990 [Flavobacteriales bacterium]